MNERLKEQLIDGAIAIVGGLALGATLIGISEAIDWATRPSAESYFARYTSAIDKAFADAMAAPEGIHTELRLISALSSVRFRICLEVHSSVIGEVRDRADAYILQNRKETGLV
ncbi:hypothetical protein D3C78_1552900 [compost metagenome]